MQFAKFIPIVVLLLSFNLTATEESKKRQIAYLPKNPTFEDVTRFYGSLPGGKFKKMIEFYLAFQNKRQYKAISTSWNKQVNNGVLGLVRNESLLKIINSLSEIEECFKKGFILDKEEIGMYYDCIMIVRFKVIVKNNFHELNRLIVKEGEADVNARLCDKKNKLISNLSKKHWKKFNHMTSSHMIVNEKGFIKFLKDFSCVFLEFINALIEEDEELIKKIKEIPFGMTLKCDITPYRSIQYIFKKVPSS